MIACICENCGNELHIPEKYAGQRGKCKRCGEAIVVPRGDVAASGIPPLKQGTPPTQQSVPSTEPPGTSAAQATAQDTSPESAPAFVPLPADSVANPAASLLENLDINPESPVIPIENPNPEPTGLAAFFHPKNKGPQKLMGAGAVLGGAGVVWLGTGLIMGRFLAMPVFLILAGLLAAVIGLLIGHQASKETS